MYSFYDVLRINRFGAEHDVYALNNVIIRSDDLIAR